MAGSFPTPEEVFEDRYRIVSVINRGGFGRVYLAQQLELNRDVAIKVLQPITRDGADADVEQSRLAVVKKRFEREAQLVSQLRDSHTVVMHDYGTTREGLLYMVLEYIDGLPLSEVIEQQGALEPERAVRIARQVLWSLQEAHALNMLHRDVKPQNIMLFDHAGRVDQVKVLDFGLAKSAESADFLAEDPDLTGDQVILGTPRYMSPEQIRGEPLGPATDIYSLGLVLFEMLAGYKAVTGNSTMNTLARHLNDVPILLPADVDVPNGLRDIVDRMLSKDATLRIQSSDDMLEALEFWDSTTSLVGTDESIAASAFLEERRRRKLAWGAVAVLVSFLVTAVIIASLREEPLPPPDFGERPEARIEQNTQPEFVQFDDGDTVRGTAVDVVENEDVVEEPIVKDKPVVEDKPPVEIEEPLEVSPDAGPTEPEEPDEPEEAEPRKPPKQNKSTGTGNSGKNKKVQLKIGILK